MSEDAIGDFILAGPRTPYWGCKCGFASNYASRIKCRCGASAPTSILQKAKRNAAAAKSQPKPRVRQKPPQQAGSDELGKLRAEVAELRAEKAAAADTGMEDVETGTPTSPIDIGKVEKTLTATIAAFGTDSKQARELEQEISRLKEIQRQGKPVSTQIRAAERRQTQRQKQHDAAKLAVLAAAEAVDQAQRELAEAKRKVTETEARVREATEELEALYQRPVLAEPAPVISPAVPAAPECVDVLCTAVGQDPEAKKALEVLRARVATCWALPQVRDVLLKQQQ